MKIATLVAVCILALGCSIASAHHEKGTSSDKGHSHEQTKNKVTITVKGKYRYITSNGLPNHEHGDFPNRHNPNTIREQRMNLRVPVKPKINRKITKLDFGPFGVALNGLLFDPGTAEYWQNDFKSGWRYEALSGKLDLGLDKNNAHVQPNGMYHYHGLPTGLETKLQKKNELTHIGYAADGFPIYARYGYTDANDPKSKLKKMSSSYKLKTGTRPDGPRGKYDGTFVADFEYVADAGDLDECNGRFGVTPEYPKGTYHYYLTEDFPFIPRAFKGTPDKSFQRRGPPPGRRPGGRRPPRGGRPPFGPPSGRPPFGPPGRPLEPPPR